MLPQEKQETYREAMFAFLEEIQNPETGYWGPDGGYNSMSGAFKVNLIYANHGRTLPMTDKMLMSIFKTIETCEAGTACYVRNAMDLLRTLAAHHGCADAIRDTLPQYLDVIIAAGRQVQAPDGGFSSSRGRALTVYGGVKAGLGIHESDVDATAMMLHARRALYPLLGLELPSLAHTAADFWKTIEEARA